jgi:foldase protein PrsA
MADGTPSPDFTPAEPHAGSRPAAPAAAATVVMPKRTPWGLLLGGTFALAAAGVGAMQLIDSEPAEAAAAAPEQNRPVSDESRLLARLDNGTSTFNITEAQVKHEAFLRHGEEVLESMINRAMVKMACNERGVSVTTREVEADITAAAKKYEIDRSTWLRMLEEDRGVTPTQYANDVIWPKLALEKLANTEVQVSDEEIRREFIRRYGPKVRARMIMVDNLRRGQEVYKLASEDPSKFGELARKYSIDEGSKALEGVIPAISMYGSEETATLEKKAFALADGEISSIIHLPFPGMQRYVILKREGLEPAVKVSLTEIRPQIEDELRERKVQEGVAKVFMEIRDRTSIQNHLTNVTTEAKKTASTGAAPAVR